MFVKILKMLGATLILFILFEFMVPLLVAICIFIFWIFGTHLVSTDSTFRIIVCLVSFALVIFLWIKAFKSIFKKWDKK